MKPMIQGPVSKRLQLKYDELLTRIAIYFNLCRYTKVDVSFAVQSLEGVPGKGLHSSTFSPTSAGLGCECMCIQKLSRLMGQPNHLNYRTAVYTVRCLVALGLPSRKHLFDSLSPTD